MRGLPAASARAAHVKAVDSLKMKKRYEFDEKYGLLGVTCEAPTYRREPPATAASTAPLTISTVRKDHAVVEIVFDQPFLTDSQISWLEVRDSF